MKKTLITLLIFSGLAMGVETLKELDDTMLTAGELKIGGSSVITSGNGALTFDIDGTTELSAYIITFGYDNLPSGAKDSWLRLATTSGCGIATTSTTAMSLRTTVWNSIDNTSITINTEDTFALTFSVDTVYLSNLTQGTYISTTISADDVDDWKFISGTAKIWTNSGENKIQVGQVADLSGLTKAQVLQVATTGTYTIPEPATATLSLLALAGLAARRRRS